MKKCKDCIYQSAEDPDLCALKKCVRGDAVNHPSHYSGDIECIDALLAARGKEEVKAFCICNSIKYLWRLGKKDVPLQEAKKVQWYINKYIELSENEES